MTKNQTTLLRERIELEGSAIMRVALSLLADHPRAAEAMLKESARVLTEIAAEIRKART